MTYLSQLNNYDNYTTKNMTVHLFQLTSLRENDIFEKQKCKTFFFSKKLNQNGFINAKQI